MDEFPEDEQGTAAMEYSLLISLLGLVIAGTVHVIGADIYEMFASINESLPSVLIIEDSHNSILITEDSHNPK